MRKTFRDEALQRKLEQSGFVVTPFLGGEPMDRFVELVNRLLNAGDHDNMYIAAGYKLTLFNKDPEYKKFLFEALLPTVQARTDEIAEDYEVYSINIFSKEPGDRFTDMHCNATLIDESVATSVSFWIPLDETDASNSTLEVVEGSHKLVDPMRSLNHPRIFDSLSQTMRDLFTPLRVRKGECVVIDDSLIHWTNTNSSDRTRTALQVVMHPKEMEPHTYYYQPELGRMQKYRSSREFVINRALFDKPADEFLIAEFPHTVPSCSEQELVAALADRRSP
ncbi:MAG: phytanoyl-CoA dioxygenase family protein [Acidobacteria bacterium]|nr:phytanoyl-CoA dioxygenase family protein [Acidobacteriota bacterium]